MKWSCFISVYALYTKFVQTRAMRPQIIQHNKYCLRKYLCKENQVQEEETMRKVFNLI